MEEDTAARVPRTGVGVAKGEARAQRALHRLRLGRRVKGQAAAQQAEQAGHKEVHEPHDEIQALQQPGERVADDAGQAIGVVGADHLGGDLGEHQDQVASGRDPGGRFQRAIR